VKEFVSATDVTDSNVGNGAQRPNPRIIAQRGIELARSLRQELFHQPLAAGRDCGRVEPASTNAAVIWRPQLIKRCQIPKVLPPEFPVVGAATLGQEQQRLLAQVWK